jgi:hypothetical protein
MIIFLIVAEEMRFAGLCLHNCLKSFGHDTRLCVYKGEAKHIDILKQGITSIKLGRVVHMIHLHDACLEMSASRFAPDITQHMYQNSCKLKSLVVAQGIATGIKHYNYALTFRGAQRPDVIPKELQDVVIDYNPPKNVTMYHREMSLMDYCRFILRT